MYCFNNISPVLPVMVGRVFAYLIRLPYLCERLNNKRFDS